MKLSSILKRAREIISKPEHWTKGALHKNGPSGEEMFCAIGAIRRVMGDKNTRVVECALQSLTQQYHKSKVESYNDNGSTSHNDIVILFDMAIARWDDHDPMVKELSACNEDEKTIREFIALPDPE